MQLCATVYKELLLLARDRAGLLVLFLMPAALVVVISLVQENVLKTTGETDIQILFIDRDRQQLGKVIAAQLEKSAAVKIVRQIKGRDIAEPAARKMIADGDYQICIVLPEKLTERIQERAVQQIRSAFASETSPADTLEKVGEKQYMENDRMPQMILYFDPMVQGSFRAAMRHSLQSMILALEMEIKARIIAETLPLQIRSIFERALQPYGMEFPSGMSPSVGSAWGKERILEISTRCASEEGTGKLPTSVQQNVPAWALFGMFFIVVPLGGAIIREKQEGTLLRLLTMPVSYLSILSGKIIAYVLVCIIQFLIILLMGIYCLPLLGTPVLETGSSPGAVMAVVCSAALAASGYGIILGTVCRSYEQAAMFGPVSIVIAAALGGIMVPVYIMPRIMQQISAFSPLAWGLNAFTDIFVRGGNLQTVLPEILLLLAFFALNMAGAWQIFIRRAGKGI